MNITTIKKIFSKTPAINSLQNRTTKNDTSLGNFHGQKSSLESLDLKSKQVQNVSLTWNPRRSILTPSKAVIEDGRLPKFILIGVMKCGTGAMSHFMNFHPSVSELDIHSYSFRFL